MQKLRERFSRLKAKFNENCFSVLLIASLFIGAVLSFMLGRSPGDNLTDSVRSLLSNLTAELIGAIVGVWFVKRLLKRQQEHNLQEVQDRVRDKIRLMSYETINRLVGAVSKREYDLINPSAFGALLDAVFDGNIATTEQLGDLFKDSFLPPVAPQAYTEVKDLAWMQLQKWKELQVLFQQHLIPSQLVSITNIIEHLQELHSDIAGVERLLEREAVNSPIEASRLAPQLKDALTSLTSAVLNLLETTFT